MKTIHIGLLSAMPSEVGKTLELLKKIKVYKYGDLTLHEGIWKENMDRNYEIYLHIAWSGWGKVSAARAATRLISHVQMTSKLDLILFTGVAGSANKNIKQWDIVIPKEVIQHDMDARPMYKKHEIPALNTDKLFY